MSALLRSLALAFVVLSVIYVAVAFWSASVRRERLEKEWEAAGRPGRRDDFVAAGMAVYRRSFRRRALMLIYVVPLTAVAIMVYLMNWG
jgi:hypothetical protein